MHLPGNLTDWSKPDRLVCYGDQVSEIEPRGRVKSRDEILDAALTLFASDGFQATSIQHVADASGYSKSSVLYHFDSKERMLDAALTPALDGLESLLSYLPRVSTAKAAPPELVEQFVDFLMAFRREAAVILIQGQSLAEMSIIQRANLLVGRLADGICAAAPELPTRMRVGVGLAGAAYVLATGEVFLSEPDIQPADEVRAALLDVLTDLFRTER